MYVDERYRRQNVNDKYRTKNLFKQFGGQKHRGSPTFCVDIHAVNIAIEDGNKP